MRTMFVISKYCERRRTLNGSSITFVILTMTPASATATAPAAIPQFVHLELAAVQLYLT